MFPRVPRVPIQRRAHRRTHAAVLVAASLLLLAACQPDPTTGSRTSAPVQPGRTSAPDPDPGEANVIRGRVALEGGTPVAGASLRIVGYTGGSSLGREIETVTSGADGTYRYDAPSGLYQVLGDGPLEFEGQTYLFHLDPADGSCEQELSEAGIVKDFVLRLSGPMQCLPGVNLDNYESYHGAALQVFSTLSGASPDDVVEYVLAPIGELADGTSVDGAYSVERTVAAHSNFFGSLGDTNFIYDIPLGRYEVSANLLSSDGGRVPLLIAGDESTTATRSVEVTFDPRLVVGTLNVGYSGSIPRVTVSLGD